MANNDSTNGSTRTNRSPVFWALIGAAAVAVALVFGISSYNVVENEPAGQAKDRTTQGQMDPSPQPTEAERSTGSVSPQRGETVQPVEGRGTTTTGQPGSSDSSR